MANGGTTEDPKTGSRSGDDDRPPTIVPVPVLLRALASYLELTGQDVRFAKHLEAVIGETGSLDVADDPDDPDGGADARPPG